MILTPLFSAVALFAETGNMSKLLYQGHGSYRITDASGIVVYVDPFAGAGYDKKADLILVTHEHSDHNVVNLPAKKTSCEIFREKDFLSAGIYKSTTVDGITITAVPAYNRNHNRAECVGYVLTLTDGITVYASGDTSYTDYMKNSLGKMNLDYALLPCDGIFNMDAEEASRCADIIGAKHAIPVHTKPGALYDTAVSDRFTAVNRLIVLPGEEIILEK